MCGICFSLESLNFINLKCVNNELNQINQLESSNKLDNPDESLLLWNQLINAVKTRG